MQVSLVTLAALSLMAVYMSFGANEKSCAELQRVLYTHWNNWDHWNLDKVHRIFGPPASIQRGAYQGYGCPPQKCDVLSFNFGGCHFDLFIDANGKAEKMSDGFHYQPSELLGRSTPHQTPQPTQLDAVYASMQTLEARTKNLEGSVARLTTLVAALQAALSSKEDARSGPPTPPRVLSRKVPSSAAPGDYLNLGPGHWLQEISSNGRILELEDGSLWEIESADQVDIALWLPITDIAVQRSVTASGDYRYVLINTEDGEKA
jgi:hypothetical protein